MESLVEAAGVEPAQVLKTRKLLILRTDKKDKTDTPPIIAFKMHTKMRPHPPIRTIWPALIADLPNAILDQGYKVDEAIRLGAKNDDCDAPAPEILFVFDAFVHRQEDR